MRVDKQISRKQTARAGSAAADVPGERRATPTKLGLGRHGPEVQFWEAIGRQ